MNTATLILNYCSGEALDLCLRSLAGSDAAALPLLVVDNDSNDDSLACVERRSPGAEVVRLPRNVGFAGGVNHGLSLLRDQGFERVLLLNPDTVLPPRFLGALEKALLDPDVALVGPKLVSPGQPRRIWCAGGIATFGLNLSRLRGHRELDQGQFDRAEDVEFLPGTVWLMRLDAFVAVGGLDDRFFCYVEDLEFCLRLREAGLRLRYEPESVVEHLGSFSSGGGYTKLRKYLNARGGWIVLRKHGSRQRWLRYFVGEILTAPLALGYGLLRCRPAAAWWQLRGLWDGYRDREFTEEIHRRLLPPARGLS